MQFSEENQLNKGLAGGALNTYLLNLTFFFIKDSLTSGALLLLSGAALLLVRRRTLVLTLGLRETLCAGPGFKFPFTSRMENVLLCFYFVLLCWIRFPYFKDGKCFTLFLLCFTLLDQVPLLQGWKMIYFVGDRTRLQVFPLAAKGKGTARTEERRKRVRIGT